MTTASPLVYASTTNPPLLAVPFQTAVTTPTVYIGLQNLTGVSSWTLTVDSTNGLNDSEYTLAITDVGNAIATLTMPAYRSQGAVFKIRSTVNNGMNNGIYDPNLTTTFLVYSNLKQTGSTQSLRYLSAGETLEIDSANGWIKTYNDLTKAVVQANMSSTYTLAGSVNDVALKGSLIKVTSNNSAYTITGMHPYYVTNYETYDLSTSIYRTLINVSAANSFVITHNSGSSTYKIKTQTAGNLTIVANAVIKMVYDAPTATWYCI